MSTDIEWKMVKLGDICQIKDGTHQTPHYVEIGKPFYSVENITNNDFIHTKFISEIEHKKLTSSYRIEKGDVLMTRIGSIGVCKYVDWNVDASFYVSLALLKCDKSIIAPKYLVFYSQSKDFKEEILSHSLQFAIPMKINLGKISEVQVCIPYKNGEPDLETQELIAQKLGDMDSLIAAKEKLLAKKRDLKIGAMQKLIKQEESENWKMVKLGDIIQYLRTGLNPRDNFKLNCADSYGYYITVRELKGFDIITDEKTDRINNDAILKINARAKIKINDILFSGTGTIGQTAIVKEKPNNWGIKEGIYCITPNDTKLDSKFLVLYLQSPFAQAMFDLMSSGSTIKSVTMEKLKQMQIFIPFKNGTPDIIEQKRIASILSDMDSEISSIEDEIAKLRNLKTAMMQKMFCFEEVVE